jgi:cellulose synthase/poly-beta-1,6-N-acetylglucosamine synthase-like glycosyltransferase
MQVVVGIMAHNEEKNIRHLLDAVLDQDVDGFVVSQIIVVSSGSTDATDEIVREYEVAYGHLRLLYQDRRYGKNEAINLFLREKESADILVLLSGDIVPEKRALAQLLAPFHDPRVGMTGGRPTPRNPDHTFLGHTAHLVWRVHHNIASKRAKLGEAVAFRDVIDHIPPDLAVDEAALEALIIAKGYELRYCENAIIFNRGPETIADFLKQRRRITCGHLHLRDKLHYEVSTFRITRAFLGMVPELKTSPRRLWWTLCACVLALYGRLLGVFDYYVLRRTHQIWDIAETTKDVMVRSGR